MPDYDNSQRAVLFANDRKNTDSHPDYKGQGEVNGVEVWLSAWIKTPKAGGKKYLSISFENKEGQVIANGVTAAPSTPATDYTPPPVAADDDIPFLWEGPVEFEDVKQHNSRPI